MPLFPLAFCVILGYYTRDWGILFRVCPFRVPKSLLPERATINYWTHRVQYRVGNRHQNRMKERDQRMTRGKEGDGGWHKRKDKKDEDSPNQLSEEHKNLVRAPLPNYHLLRPHHAHLANPNRETHSRVHTAAALTHPGTGRACHPRSGHRKRARHARRRWRRRPRGVRGVRGRRRRCAAARGERARGRV